MSAGRVSWIEAMTCEVEVLPRIESRLEENDDEKDDSEGKVRWMPLSPGSPAASLQIRKRISLEKKQRRYHTMQ
jgi:hypothetical protein